MEERESDQAEWERKNKEKVDENKARLERMATVTEESSSPKKEGRSSSRSKPKAEEPETEIV